MADSDFERKNLPRGHFGPYNENEVALVSTIGDPSMLWIASTSGLSLGALTFGRARTDGSGHIDAMVMIQGKQDERTRHLSGIPALVGEVTIHVRKGDTVLGNDDAEFVKVFELRHDGVWWIGKDGTVPPTMPAPPPLNLHDLPAGTQLLLHGGATIVTGSTPAPAPGQPSPAPEPLPAPSHAATFNWKGQTWVVDPGDFSALETIFGFRLDKSDIEDYQRTGDWQAVIDLYKYKSEGDE